MLKTIYALALAAALALLGAGQAGADPVASATADAGVRAYWTPQRMRAAEPLETPTASGQPLARSATGSTGDRGTPRFLGASDPGAGPVAEAGATAATEDSGKRARASAGRDLVPNPADAPFRAHGKIFFTVEGGSEPGDYLCSGTSVTSNNRSVVWTAGHCVYDNLGGGFVKNWIFVPAYEDGEAPFGEWPAVELATTEQWKRSAPFKYDLGAAIVATNGAGRSLGEVVGARGIAFNQPRSNTYVALGYPAIQPPVEFDGERMFRCTSPLLANDDPGGPGPRTMQIDCDMNGGSSGGGWVAGETLLSVSSYKYFLEDDRLYGPYLADVAEELYAEVTGDPILCGGKEATHVGTDAGETITGTAGADVIVAMGGDDRINGGGGKDLICGGGGDDTLKGSGGRDELRGGGGDDTLKGNRGRDKLKGGGGDDALHGGKARDRCIGGGGTDTGSSCERRRSIP